MQGYGKQILQNSILDVCLKTKNRLVTRIQYRILNLFGKLPDGSLASLLFARVSRGLVGGYIYSIKLEINDYCDLDCKGCYVSKGESEIRFETIARLLDDIKSFGIRLEILGGEPLQHPDIVKIVDYAHSHAKCPFITLYTNGIPATEKISRDLKEAGLDAPIVSLISNKREVHDEFTGKAGSWEKTIRGITNLADVGLKVYTFTPIHTFNFKDVKNIYNFVKNELGVSALFYQYIPQKKNDPLMIDPNTWHSIKHWVLMEKSREHMEFVRKFFMLTGNACSGGNFVLTVKADGSVQPCPFISDLPLGNIYQDNIWSIYKRRFLREHLRSFKAVPEECHNCTYRTVCGGGCKAGNNFLYGRYDRKDYRCLGPYTKDLKKEEVMDCIPTFF
jgi:radical SAM protein with 4Fe4S-binding SPASM domain